MSENSNWYVYIVRCSDNTLYTGITKNVIKRIDEHNQGRKLAARYTRGRRPVELVYQEKLSSRSQASTREYQIKQMGKKEKENLVS
ncbi:GIY-YIG nuclease family protein [Pseudomonadota bacterium]